MPRIAYERKKFGQRRLAIIRVANQIISEYAEQGYDLTLRQLYYQFVARDVLPNVAKSYDLLQGVVNDARMSGMIDWDAIVDRTRNIKVNPHWDDPAAALETMTKMYARDKWLNQPTRPEVWIEKDALIGVIEPVCRDLDLTHFSCRGYVSQSEMWAASNRLRGYIENDQKVVVLHLGDHDPSGIDMTRDIHDRLWTFICGDYWAAHPEYSEVNIKVTMESMFEVKRIALTMDQIEELDPPPNPAKLTDSRAADYVSKYGDSSWELDALEPTYLGDLIRGEVWDLMDHDLMSEARAEEEEDISMIIGASERWPDIEALLTEDQ